MIEAEYVWVLDPIDGTKSFISGMPMWGTLIGLLRNGEPTYGMMVQPFTRERFVGDCVVARWCGPGHDHAIIERKLRARSAPTFAQATLMTTSPLLYPPPKLESFPTPGTGGAAVALWLRLLCFRHARSGQCRLRH